MGGAHAGNHRILKDNNGNVVIISDLETTTLKGIIDRFASSFNSSRRVLLYEAFNYEYLRQANGMLFNTPVVPL